MPKISVIVPVYNVAQYLPQCIESLLGQTLEDIEVILVDDGSQDKSSQICDSYAQKDERIKVRHKINGGLSDARNAGLEIAQGEYIAFLDSDDWVEKNVYEYLYNLIQKEDADIVQCDYIKAFSEDAKIDFSSAVTESICTNIEALCLLYGEEYVKTVVVWNKLYKRAVFDNIRFPKGKIHEDEFTTYKLLHHANKVVNSNYPLIYYRQREGSIMSQAFSEKRLHILEAYNESMEYFNRYNLDKLVQLAECRLCGQLRYLYVQVQKSQFNNKKKVLKQLKKSMRGRYIRFIINPFIRQKGKVALTLCLLNGAAFCKIQSSMQRMDCRSILGRNLII